MAKPVLLLLVALLAIAIAYTSAVDAPAAAVDTPAAAVDAPAAAVDAPAAAVADAPAESLNAGGPMPSSLIPIDTTPLPASDEGEHSMDDYGGASLGSPLGTTMRMPEPDQSESDKDDKDEKSSAADLSFGGTAISVGAAAVAGYWVI